MTRRVSSAGSVTSFASSSGDVKVGSFDVSPRGDGYLYVAARAVTADKPNLNYDMFPADELRKSYRTFVGGCVYLNHDNTDPAKARGAIVDARLHDENPDDVWVEILMELDEERCPKLCALIRSGEIDTFSMGCTTEYSTCSVCGREASDESEFCEHMLHKGRRYDGVLAYEVCHGIEFFEESAVYSPADPTARTVAVLDGDGGGKVGEGGWYDEDGTLVLSSGDLTAVADDDGYWCVLDGDMSAVDEGVCDTKEDARDMAERSIGRTGRRAWKDRNLFLTPEMQQVRVRPDNRPVATGPNEPLMWYDLTGADAICADYGRGFIIVRCYESYSGEQRMLVQYNELESPSSLVATGNNVNIREFRASGREPTGADFLRGVRYAEEWSKSDRGIGLSFASRGRRTLMGMVTRTAQEDVWVKTDNGDGSATYTDGSGDVATVKPHESGQGYGYEIKDQSGEVKGYGWAQTADEAAQKAMSKDQQAS